MSCSEKTVASFVRGVQRQEVRSAVSSVVFAVRFDSLSSGIAVVSMTSQAARIFEGSGVPDVVVGEETGAGLSGPLRLL
ncbi:hypothetical protein EBO15_02930 [Actinomadura harenae]|uniref:Uncharacterized protein n=1 Tax=Actinomadura harenae TaxID=2483351 RepID=A0A3M2MD53_9ACTN|nr:hypothetical protein EBO15_02930 [Actinomadura harenae]